MCTTFLGPAAVQGGMPKFPKSDCFWTRILSGSNCWCLRQLFVEHLEWPRLGLRGVEAWNRNRLVTGYLARTLGELGSFMVLSKKGIPEHIKGYYPNPVRFFFSLLFLCQMETMFACFGAGGAKFREDQLGSIGRTKNVFLSNQTNPVTADEKKNSALKLRLTTRSPPNFSF